MLICLVSRFAEYQLNEDEEQYDEDDREEEVINNLQSVRSKSIKQNIIFRFFLNSF